MAYSRRTFAAVIIAVALAAMLLASIPFAQRADAKPLRAEGAPAAAALR